MDQSRRDGGQAFCIWQDGRCFFDDACSSDDEITVPSSEENARKIVINKSVFDAERELWPSAK